MHDYTIYSLHNIVLCALWKIGLFTQHKFIKVRLTKRGQMFSIMLCNFTLVCEIHAQNQCKINTYYRNRVVAIELCHHLFYNNIWWCNSQWRVTSLSTKLKGKVLVIKLCWISFDLFKNPRENFCVLDYPFKMATSTNFQRQTFASERKKKCKAGGCVFCLCPLMCLLVSDMRCNNVIVLISEKLLVYWKKGV